MDNIDAYKLFLINRRRLLSLITVGMLRFSMLSAMLRFYVHMLVDKSYLKDQNLSWRR